MGRFQQTFMQKVILDHEGIVQRTLEPGKEVLQGFCRSKSSGDSKKMALILFGGIEKITILCFKFYAQGHGSKI